jgi:hypothetical protein
VAKVPKVKKSKKKSRKHPSGIEKITAFHPGEIGNPKPFHRAGESTPVE